MTTTKHTYKQPSARLVTIYTESLIATSPTGGSTEGVVQDISFTPTSTRRQESPWESE